MSHTQDVSFHACPFGILQFGVVNGFQTADGNKIKLLEAKYKPPGASKRRQEWLRMTREEHASRWPCFTYTAMGQEGLSS